MNDAIIVDFPLRGEWVAPNTPGSKVPSHGTDQLGQRYAFDFIQVDWSKGKDHFGRASALQYLTVGIATSAAYCWRAPVFAVLPGVVVCARDGLKEPRWLNPWLDMLRLTANSLKFAKRISRRDPENADLHDLVGNYVILKHEACYSFYAHLHPETVQVKAGDNITAGQLLGKVGHTGNSTSPHLHFQLMDSASLMQAKGLPCAFTHLEIYADGTWTKVDRAIPASDARIRYV
jgi:hypothetical protein